MGKLYKSIWADPPWYHNDQRKVRKDGKTPTKGIGANLHYDLMKNEDILNLGPLVNQIRADRCHLHLWATMPLLPEALHCMACWGFKYATTEYVWVKLNRGRVAFGQERLINVFRKIGVLEMFLHWLTKPGPGYYTMSNVEVVLLGRHNRPFRHAPEHKPRQVQYAPLEKEHSKKPDLFQELDRWAYPQCTPRIELFGRRDLEGFTVVGNEAPLTMGQDIRKSLQAIIAGRII